MARSDVDVALGAARSDTTSPFPRPRPSAPTPADARLIESIRRALVSDDPVARLLARCRQEVGR